MASRTDAQNRKDPLEELTRRFVATRRLSLDLVATLSDADAVSYTHLTLPTTERV